MEIQSLSPVIFTRIAFILFRIVGRFFFHWTLPHCRRHVCCGHRGFNFLSAPLFLHNPLLTIAMFLLLTAHHCVVDQLLLFSSDCHFGVTASRCCDFSTHFPCTGFNVSRAVSRCAFARVYLSTFSRRDYLPIRFLARRGHSTVGLDAEIRYPSLASAFRFPFECRNIRITTVFLFLGRSIPLYVLSLLPNLFSQTFTFLKCLTLSLFFFIHGWILLGCIYQILSDHIGIYKTITRILIKSLMSFGLRIKVSSTSDEYKCSVLLFVIILLSQCRAFLTQFLTGPAAVNILGVSVFGL